MSQNICIDPRFSTYDFSEQVCRSEELLSSPPNPARSSAEFTTTTPAPSAAAFRNPALFQDRETFQRSIFRSAFAMAPARRSAGLGSPLASSLWGLAALLPVACSTHPALEGGESEDGGSSDDGSGGSEGGVRSPIPEFHAFTTHATAPCGAEGMITDLDENLGVCANYVSGEHHLFAWNPAAPAEINSVIPLTYPPDQVLRGADGAIYINTHQNPGLAVVRPSPGSETHHAFPESVALIGTSSSGRSLPTLRPSFPKGLVQIGDRIFVATSNYDEVHADFQPGTVLAFDTLSQDFSILPTTAFNPTGLAYAGGRLLVVNSGVIDRYGQVTSAGSLDVFNPNTFELEQSLALGQRGAGLAGEIAVSGDGSRLVLPTADNSGRIILVDWPSSQVREIDLRAAGIGGERIFFSNLQISEEGDYAVVSNFNDGRVYTVDLNLGTLAAEGLAVDDLPNDATGLSDGLRWGGEYFVGFGPDLLHLSR